MWNEKAQPLVDSGKLAVLGVIQEQHAERARLYAQWKQLNWPIVQDALTQLDLDVVPVAILIDEHGIVQKVRAEPKDLDRFVVQLFDAPASKSTILDPGANAQGQSVPDLIAAGDQAFIWSTSETRFADAINSYQQALVKKPGNGKAMFRLGVAHRARYDSNKRQPGDFDLAVANWTSAIKVNPNQYIWRRRIQQYGPRQSKPYPFYDWVAQATSEIKARGQEPIQLKIPLSGAEVSKPHRTFVSDSGSAENPDPDNKITVNDKLVKIARTVVPAVVKKGEPVRIHLRLTPVNAKWNNEGPPLKIWINESSNGQTSNRLLEIPNPDKPESTEMRTVEFEFQTDKLLDKCKVSGFALYSVCETESGQCFFNRQDFEIEIPVGNQ